MQNKGLIAVIVAVFLLFAAVVYYYNQALDNFAANSCMVANCPHQQIVQVQNVVIFILLVIIGILIAWIYSQNQKKHLEQSKVSEAPTNYSKHVAKIDVSSFDEDEQKVLSVLNDSGGSAFQSDIIKKTEYSKVSVSRILDKLEQKGVLERKRRGMTNIIVLK